MRHFPNMTTSARSAWFALRGFIRVASLFALLAFFIASHTVPAVASAVGNLIATVMGQSAPLLANSSREISALKERNFALDNERKQLADSLALERHMTGTLAADVNATRDRASQFQQELSEERATVSRLTQDLSAERGTVSQLGRELTESRTKVSELEHENTRLRDEQTVVYRGNRVSVKAAAQDAIERSSKRTSAAAAANLSSMAGESIPIYGIYLIIAATSLEIYSACETMSDLYELQIAIDPSSAVSMDRDDVCGMRIPSFEQLWQMARSAPSEVWRRTSRLLASLSEAPLNLPSPNFDKIWWRSWNWLRG